MAKNFVQEGDALTIAAPAEVKSGAPVRAGVLFGVALHDAANGASLTIATEGVWTLPKPGSQAWTVGAAIYFDHDANPPVATTATTAGNILIGVAVEAVGSGAGETVGKVRLNGSVPAAAT